MSDSYIAKFDSCPDTEGAVILRETSTGDDVIIRLGADEQTLFELNRDQWGVFVCTEKLCVAQEDGTRSFLDAIIGALTKLRTSWEFETTSATVEESSNDIQD